MITTFIVTRRITLLLLINKLYLVVIQSFKKIKKVETVLSRLKMLFISKTAILYEYTQN